MRIVHCLFSLETGGAEILAVDLLKEISAEHEVSLVIINNKWDPVLLSNLGRGVSVYFLNRTEGSRNPIPLLKLNFLLMRLRPDVIHCHDPKIAHAVKVPTGKFLHTVHDMGRPVKYYDLYHSIVAISDAVYRDVVLRSGLPVTRIYNGVPVELFTKRAEYKGSAGVPLKLVQISRLMHEKKGQDILLHALSLLRSKYQQENFILDLIGSGRSLVYLRKLAASLCLDDKVNFIGERRRDWLFSNLSEYHIMIQPSRYEGFGLTIIEGLAAGIPVLASDIDGPAEIISKLSGGFLFKNNDPADCAACLNRIMLMYTDGSIADRMADCREKISDFSLLSCAESYVEQYRKLAEGSIHE
jgi:glycosyltransferase involved in cell wall biosynthesis